MVIGRFWHKCVGINETIIPFVSSDNPAIFVADIFNRRIPMVYFPVTPKRCIFLIKREPVKRQFDIVMKEFLSGTFKCNNLFEITKEANMREKNFGK